MRMKKQLRKMSASAIMHHPAAAQATQAAGATTQVAAFLDPKVTQEKGARERRTSSNSDSSVEPMEISASGHHTMTSPSDANNSSLLTTGSKSSSAAHINGHSSDEEDDDQNNNHNSPLKKLYIQTRRGLVNGNNNRSSGRRSDEDADVEEDDKDQPSNYLTILRKKGRYSSSSRSTALPTSAAPPEEKWNGNTAEVSAAAATQNSTSSSDVTCRICSKVFMSPAQLMSHIVVHHHQLLDNNKSAATATTALSCHICQMPFLNGANLHSHLLKSHKAELEATDSDDEGAVSTDSSASSRRRRHNNHTDGVANSQFKLNNNKRKSMDDLNDDEDDEDDGHVATDGRIVVRKRKMRTINNNDILANNNNLPAQTTVTHQKYCCPACDRNDFPTMSSVEYHMDEDHPSIVPKCKHCGAIFKGHRQLNAHRCTQAVSLNRALNRNQQITQGFKDLTFVDFSSNKFPYIAKSICEQSIRTPIAEQKFECHRCYRAFPCEAALNIHNNDCTATATNTSSNMNMSLQSDGSHDFEGRLLKRRLSEDEGCEGDLKRDDFFANLDLQNKSIASSNNNPLNSSSGQFSPHSSSNSSAPTSPLNNAGVMAAAAKHFQQKFQQGLDFGRLPFDLRKHDGKDLADIESIINVTSGGRFFKHLDQSTTTGSSSNKSVDLNSSLNSSKDQEEEAQDAFTSEFRKMKLRGEFPCKLCTAVYPNLRALKGHNRVHLSAAGSGPYRCNMCPYSIHDKAALIRHMRTHNGDRPYECAFCNYAFTTKANCERHLRNRHGKSTRDDIKRAIIYHPSEDSSCDDPHKKMAMFAATDFGAAPLPDMELHGQHSRDSKENRTSTPVSHLKEMLMPVLSSPTMVPMLPKHASSPLGLSPQQMHKIQVKSLEKLIKPSGEEMRQQRGEIEQKMPFGSDALDLTKKIEAEKIPERNSRPSSPLPPQLANIPGLPFAMPKFDRKSLLERQEQLLMAQQELFKDALPKMGPAQYFQELYRNFLFPGAFPFMPFFGAPPTNGNGPEENPMLANVPNPMLDIKSFMHGKDASAGNPLMSGGSALLNPATFFSHSAMLPNQMAQTPSQPPLKAQMKSPDIPNDLLKSMSSMPGTPTGANQSGSVKMVIKNGVLMPKQKQRRYRTERPFACEHCSARFTLRSNMERHIKQQHPQYWAQRQRSGHQLLRRSHGSAAGSPSGLPSMVSPGGGGPAMASVANPFSNLSEEMKFLLQLNRDQKMPFAFDPAKFTEELERRREEALRSQELLHRDDMDDENDEDMMEDEEEEEEEEDDGQLVIDEEPDQETVKVKREPEENNFAAKKVAESILEQAMKKNLASAEPSDREEDLASITKLVDNARTGTMSFNNFFRSDRAASTEQSDEEGLVASGSASEENQSGAEDQVLSGDQQKKKSAYSLAPNRVACPYCQRMFPWTSSLRRHILTHTGQKPFKCSHCPLLFTTKSNCDRHLLRKHGNVESAVSLYMPIEDNEIPEPTPIAPKPEAPVAAIKEPSNIPALIPVAQLPPRPPKEVPEEPVAKALPAAEPSIPSVSVNQLKSSDGANMISSDMPFKCHLCDSSFPERLHCLEHIKAHHSPEYELLVANGAIEMDANAIFSESAEDEKKSEGKGKYPDYANRKVICAFCVRRFWSAEDLRRHMRTHSGERPFQCDVCSRKFTLKHSMLRHQKKHQRRGGVSNQSCSDLSDDEVTVGGNQARKATPPTREPSANSQPSEVNGEDKAAAAANAAAFHANLNEIMKRRVDKNRPHPSILGMLMSRDLNLPGQQDDACDFLANMLGIGDQNLLAKAFQSPDEAAKLLGVDK